MAHKVSVGLIQMSSTGNAAENMLSAESLIREAASRGAQIVITPEMTVLLELDRVALLEKIHFQEEDPSLPKFQALAKELNIWLVIGSMAVKVKEDAGDKIANRCFILSPEGKIVAHYDKIHMFDVDLPDGESYRESRSYAAGDRAVVVETPLISLGLSICYDLRFPHLYRLLAQEGAQMITVPAAFTAVTGKAHWHILLQARAIENGVFICAAAQTGSHKNARGEVRQTYGHSLFVDPWGNIIDDGGTNRGVIVAELDLDLVKKARSRVPSLVNDSPFMLEKQHS